MKAATLPDGGATGRRGIESRSESLRNAVPRDRAPGFVTYIGIVALGGTAILALNIQDVRSILDIDPLAFWIIAALAVLIDALPFAAPGRRADLSIFPSIGFSFAVLLGWGLVPAILVQSAAVVVSSVRLRHPPWRAIFNAAQYALSLSAAALVLTLVGGPALTADSRISVLEVLAILGAAVVWFVVNDLLVSTAVWFRFGGDWRTEAGHSLGEEALSTLGLLALGPLVMATANVSPALVPLTLIPLFAVNEFARFTQQERTTALRDELTGLPNRKALLAEMRVQAGARSRRASRQRGDGRRMALLLLDIDQFRRVNDALGHTVGDRLLGAVATRLRECVGTDGFVARMGGDEFGVFAPRLADAAAAAILAERVADALAEPVTLDTLPLDVTAAVGVAVFPDHGSDNTTLLRHAEVAMYDAKDRGATHAVYTPESDQNSPERLELVADLRRAIEASRPDEIQLHYQPQVDLATHEVVGVEALLRWHHPRRGPMSPDDVIKAAEHTAVMRLLTHRVLEEAIIQLAKWRAQGLYIRTSVNVSVRDLRHPELVEELETMLNDRGVPANQLQLEITEGALMADPRRVLVTLHRLDKLGVALSLDDFGTGYSSLQHLRRLPLAEVKIDRSFVLGMASDPDDAAVVTSIIDLARALGLRVVAEGVEDDVTRRRLVDGGCEVAQGWYFARPMPADALVAWLARYRPSGVGEQTGVRDIH
jgi:diguanylate cyclase (GGDEF)-like protein